MVYKLIQSLYFVTLGREILNKIYKEIKVIDKSNLVTDFDNIVFEYVNQFLAIYEEENYPLVILKSSSEVSSVKIGCLLDICIWSTKDNGAKQHIEIEKWIYSDDERKIEVALSITNVYPINNFEELKFRLIEIELKFPRLKELCNFSMPKIQKMKDRKEID